MANNPSLAPQRELHALYFPHLGCSQTCGHRQVRSSHTGAFHPLLSQAELVLWQDVAHPAAVCRWVLNGQLSLCSGLNSSYFRGSGNFPGREETRGSGSCFSGWDLKRSLLEKQMQEAPLSKNSRRPRGSLLKSCWEAFLNQKRQHNMLMLQHNCVGYQLKKHWEPARIHLCFYIHYIFPSEIPYSLHATLKSVVTPIGEEEMKAS